MNKFVPLLIVLATLGSGACRANDAGLCKPVCAEEKRACRAAALKMIDHDAQSLTEWREKNPMAREFGKGSVHINQPVGPAVRNQQERRMTRNAVCDDKFMTCSKACTASASKAQF